MGLNGIMSSALTALQTNSTALRVVSTNVANVNTDGYSRRVVNLQTLSAGGQLAGVDIASITRVVDQFINRETLSATGAAARYDVQNSTFAQLNSLLGTPGDASSLITQLTNVFSSIGQATLSPSDSAARVGLLSSMTGLAGSISNISSSISNLQSQLDQQVAATTGSANALIKQIYDLNTQVKSALAAGNTDSALLDQRDVALKSLAQLVSVRTVEQSDGRVAVMTNDGINIVGDSYARLSYTSGGTNGAYGPIMIENINPLSGQTIGTAYTLDQHLDGGRIKGLIETRDSVLGGLAQELGQFAQQTALAYNQVHNANAAFPPPTTLTGRNTGLVSGDALNFTGNSTFAVTDSNGGLVSRIDVDFGAHSYSVDGGPAVVFTNTVGGFATALNSALGANGSASFANGVLSIAATGTNGIVVQDDASTPSSRGGFGVSQYFGLNDLFQSAVPNILSTGLSGTDSSGLAAGGQITLALKGPNGDVAKTGTVNITAGMTIDDVVNAMNTAMGGAATYTLNSDGSISESVAAALSNYQVNVTRDTTQRGTTGLGFSQIFGIGANTHAQLANNFSLTSSLSGSPQRLAFAKPTITASTTAGDLIVGHGDASGAIALQNIGTAQQSFSSVGNLGAQVSTLADYAGAFYQDVATRSNAADTAGAAQTDRLAEAQSRQAQKSGVNLDEELSNMMVYQQAYNAGARMLQVVQELYDTLFKIA